MVVAFSGGVDSTLLLALAADVLGTENVLAAVGISPSIPDREREEARRLAETAGVELVEFESREFDDPNFTRNPVDRCYHCKSALFAQIWTIARERGFPSVICGANADDPGDYRPGLDAGMRAGVVNPLMEAGLTKADIRAASRIMGLVTWDKPAMACLASRIPYDSPITPERLARVGRAEEALRGLGFGECRVRDYETLARIEVPRDSPGAGRPGAGGDRLVAQGARVRLRDAGSGGPQERIDERGPPVGPPVPIAVYRYPVSTRLKYFKLLACQVPRSMVLLNHFVSRAPVEMYLHD